ncbi:hypothetical protein LWC08_03745 [Desulfobaculum bizertense]|uniref:hypothetical protein n=1 Tax=Desulfobaculum bizertense TaxID=376490 RepID=UPI001F2C9C40|nr:hypothetical protein [Desulfobaculum bizertense]UIJ38692.1 hypothetical protein LWC08_03745 [Desulfobaculum bizertense]
MVNIKRGFARLWVAGSICWVAVIVLHYIFTPQAVLIFRIDSFWDTPKCIIPVETKMDSVLFSLGKMWDDRRKKHAIFIHDAEKKEDQYNNLILMMESGKSYTEIESYIRQIRGDDRIFQRILRGAFLTPTKNVFLDTIEDDLRREKKKIMMSL